MPTPEDADAAVGTRLRKETAPLPEYLLSRCVAGATHEDIMEAVKKLTHHGVICRFFHMFPEVPEDLFLWLKEWIDLGAVPMATLNLQRGVAEDEPIPDAWHHQMIHGVSSEGVHLTNPCVVVPFSRLKQQLSSESVLLICANDIVSRWSPDSNYTLLREGRWQEMKVEEKVEQMVADVLAHRPCASHVLIPAVYKSGITVFSRKGSSAGDKLT